MATTTNTSGETRYGWLISLAFWLSLLAAAVLYGVVALAPKYLAHLELQNRYHAGQVQLVQLEQQIHHLERVANALENDPHFADELARRDFEAARPGDERIEVEPGLTLDAPINVSAPERQVRSLPWYGTVLGAMVGNRRLRNMTLLVAVGLTLVAFTFLHESQEAQLRTGVGRARGLLAFIVGRYRKA